MNTDNNTAEAVRTVLVITVGLLVLHLAFSWQWALPAAVAIGLGGLLSGFLARRIAEGWMKLAGVLALLVPNILLSLIYLLVLTPVAWLSRIFGDADPLQLKNSQKSLFKSCNRTYGPESFRNPW